MFVVCCLPARQCKPLVDYLSAQDARSEESEPIARLLRAPLWHPIWAPLGHYPGTPLAPLWHYPGTTLAPLGHPIWLGTPSDVFIDSSCYSQDTTDLKLATGSCNLWE